MSNADIYNIIAPIGIILAILFGLWVNGQTNKTRHEIATLNRKSPKRKPTLRASRRH